MRALVLSVFFIFSHTIHARETSFFRTPDGLYNSGAYETETLYKKILSQQTQQWLRVEFDHPQNPTAQGWIQKSDVSTSGYAPLEKDWVFTKNRSVRSYRLPQVQSPKVYTLSPQTPVRIVEETTVTWNQSQVPEHGKVWWTDLSLVRECPPADHRWLTNAQIFSRRIFDMASSPIDPNIKVASANGVFMTLDGEHWYRIAKFRFANLPVVFTLKGSLFVGGLKSTDNGKTFTPTFKWDKIASRLIGFTRASPSRIRLLSLNTIDDKDEKIVIEVGVGRNQRVKLVSPDEGLTWEASQTKSASSLSRFL